MRGIIWTILITDIIFIHKMEYRILSNGNKMPCIGLGTDDVLFVRHLKQSNNRLVQKLLNIYHYRLLRPILSHQLAETIEAAINNGLRLIDTSAAYNNEKEIGRAIRESKVKRDEMFITSRVSNRQQYDGNIRDSFFLSLKKLGLEYIDLYMMHWPVPDHFLKTWKEMEKLYDEGLIKNLGVANCHQHHIEEIMSICEIKPVVNQIEIHPLFTQKPLLAYCKSEGIQVEAYSPLAQNNDRLRNNRTLKLLAQKYGKSMQQIILRWHIENGVIPIPRSSHVDRIINNMDIFDFQLTKDEVEKIDGININS